MKNKKLLILIVVVATLSLIFSDAVASYMMTNVLNATPKAEPFNGTVLPFEKVPDYTKLTAEERAGRFEDIPKSKLMDPPDYDPRLLQTDINDLKWGDAEDNVIRNMLINYPVVYAGNYKMDGVEGAGSHFAVDWYSPVGNPLRAIANGVVTKVSYQSSGFGNHVVVKHENVPSLENENKLTTYYSSFSHLESSVVEVGDVVSKGEIIAYSGNTGTSTAPHVHFQIDNANSPWQPSWPFSWKESSDAGLSFFEAVNSGLGSEKGYKMTIHPMNYVLKYLDADAKTVSVQNPPKVEAPKENIEVKVEEEPVPTPIDEDFSEDIQEDNEEPEDETEEQIVEEEEDNRGSSVGVKVAQVLNFEFEMADKYVIDGEGHFKVMLRDQYGNPYEDSFTDQITIRSERDRAKINKPLLNYMSFKGEDELRREFTHLEPGKDRLYIRYKEKDYYSQEFEIVEQSEDGFADLKPGDKHYKAITYLYDEGFVNGYDDGTYKPNQGLNRAETFKFVASLAGLNKKYGKIPFPDAEQGAWYSSYAKALYDAGVIKGDNNGYLKPAQPLNNAEFLKILLLAKKEEVRQPEPGETWYAPYVKRAVEMGIVDENNFSPEALMTRGDVAEASYRLLTL
jgi:murein DD-endopeptidase MepM/ murein hydrolase activator NlpD